MSKNDLIYREDVFKLCDSLYDFSWVEMGFSEIIDKLMSYISQLPSVAKQQKGKWLIDYYDMNTYSKATREATDVDTAPMFCSLCHNYAGLNSSGESVPSKYCPNCGVMMEVKIKI